MTLLKHPITFLLILAAACSSAAESKQKLNVVIILADDLGWADLSCYGSTFHETPHLDELAREGMRFTQGYAAHSYCSPTRAALLTGRDPARLKITDYIPSNNKSGKYLPAQINKELPLAEVTLAEILRDAGYATWHVGKWHLGHGEKFLPEKQGFDINIAGNQSGMPASFFWPYGNDDPKRRKAYHNAPVPGLVEGGKKGEHLCDRITREAIGLIEKRDKSKPFFLYLPFYDVHTPIQAKPELIEKYKDKAEKVGLPTPDEAKRFREGNAAQGSGLRDHLVFQCNPTYAAMVETMDDNVGRLMAALDKLKLAENTLVIFTSDNGGLNQHNFGRTPVTSNAPLRACKGWLYEGGVREPWIVRLPGVTKPGSVCDQPIIATDVSPTVLAACNLPAKPDLHLDGKNILPLLKGGSEPIHKSIQWHFPHYGNTGSGPCSSIRVGDWKLIEWYENDSVELFNLATDMGETTDLAAKHPDKTEELKKRLAVWREDVDANMLRPKPAAPPTSSPTIKPQGEFSATSNVRVEKLVKDAGYRLHAAEGKSGFALKKLDRPLQGKATFKFHCSTAAGHEFPKRWVNGFLTISDGVDPSRHIHIGAFFGGQKKLTVIEGPLTPNTPHSQPLTENATPLAFTVHLDLAANEIVLEERGGARLSATLRRPIKQITHIGYSALDAVTEFSHWKAADSDSKTLSETNGDQTAFSESVWIGFPPGSDGRPARNAHYAFRHKLSLEDKPSTASVRVTADARYVLWVNGTYVGRGPARCYPWRQAYDEHDLAPFLHKGANWIAAQIHEFGYSNGQHIYSGKHGLIMEGDVKFASGSTQPLRTNEDWQARHADWQLAFPGYFSWGQTGFQEGYDARLEPVGWRVGAGEAGWRRAVKVAAPGEKPWKAFEPRGTKPMKETLVKPERIVWVARGANPPDALTSKNPWLVWKKSSFEPLAETPRTDNKGWVTVSPEKDGFVALAFDYGWNHAAHPRIEVRDAKGGEILDNGCAYSLKGSDQQPSVWGVDAGPNSPGQFDRFIAGVGDSQWQSFILQGFRYQVVVVRADHPVTIRVEAIRAHHDVGSPLSFKCSDPALNQVWETTDRTLRAGMLDAFVDNNFREQQQWLHDGCVAALGAWATYGDTGLWKRGLLQWGQSSRLHSDGAFDSAAPRGWGKPKLECIPDYNCVWPVALAQYHDLTGDSELLREVLPDLRRLMRKSIEAGMTTEGLFLHPPGRAVFLDWVQRPWNKNPYNLTLNLVVLRAYRNAARVAEIAGDEELAEHCRMRDREVTAAVEARFWSDEHNGWRENIDPSDKIKADDRTRNWLRDPWHEITVNSIKRRDGDLTPTPCTRHGNALAVLLKLGTPRQQKAAAELVVRAFQPDDPNNNGMSPLWTDKIFGALFEAGLDKDAIRLIQNNYGHWVTKRGAMHWSEGFTASRQTHAHTCGSSVNWLLTSYVLGIRPGSAGFRDAIFDPRAGELTSAKGSVPTPLGLINVEWQRKGDVIEAMIETPTGVTLNAPSPNVRLNLKPSK